MSTTERQDAPDQGVLDSGRTGALHRLTGAAPIGAALLVVAGAVSLVSPGVRHTLDESFRRQPERYVELYVTDPARAASCSTVDGRLRVGATVRSHLAGPQDLRYAVALTAAGRTVDRASGTVVTSPGRASDFGATLTVPSGAYAAVVTLPGRAERLTVHCPARG